MTSWLLTLLVAVSGFHFQSLIKNNNQIKRSVRRSKTVIKALVDEHEDSPPTQVEFAAVLPRSPRPLLSTRLALTWQCYRRGILRAWLTASRRARRLGRATADRCLAMLRWLGAKSRTRSDGDASPRLPPKLYRYETSYASLLPDPAQGLAVDDVQLDWRTAADAREAARLCGIEFAVNIEDLPRPGSGPLGPPGNDFYVYATERCIIWARRMTKRLGRRPR